MRSHLIPHIAELKFAEEMYDALVGLFESKNINRKLALRNQLRCIKMTKEDTVATFFIKVSQTRDQLKAIEEDVVDSEFTSIVLNGFPDSWEPFIQSVCGREELPKFEDLWVDCVQDLSACG